MTCWSGRPGPVEEKSIANNDCFSYNNHVPIYIILYLYRYKLLLITLLGHFKSIIML